MHRIVHREKKMQPEPRSPVIGGSSPKCGPHLKRRGEESAPQYPAVELSRRRTLQRLGHNSHGASAHDICAKSIYDNIIAKPRCNFLKRHQFYTANALKADPSPSGPLDRFLMLWKCLSNQQPYPPLAGAPVYRAQPPSHARGEQRSVQSEWSWRV